MPIRTKMTKEWCIRMAELEGNMRLRQVALETIASLVSEMGSSPVGDTTIITRQQLEIFADYVVRVRPDGYAAYLNEEAKK